MFDTVHFWIPNYTYDANKILQTFSDLSIITKDEYYHNNDNLVYSGYIDNYRVRFDRHGISLKGSIAKYTHGVGTSEFANRLEYKKGIEKLFSLLNLDLNNATITRVDVGQNLNMKKPVLDYYPMLVAASRLTRLELQNSLYFQNNRKELIFYDKAKEREQKGFSCNYKNLLRYELKLKRNPKSFLKLGTLHAKDLYKKSICQLLLNFWFEEFEKIQKISDCKPVLDYQTQKEFITILAAITLSDYKRDIYREFETKVKKRLLSPTNVYRIKHAISDLEKNVHRITDRNSLMNELNAKIKSKHNDSLKSL